MKKFKGNQKTLKIIEKKIETQHTKTYGIQQKQYFRHPKKQERSQVPFILPQITWIIKRTNETQ
jgi:hypothetical protein